MSARPVLTSSTRPTAATAVGWLGVIGALGSAAMTVAHLGVALPLLGGGVVLWPVAVGFALGTLLYAATALGAFRLRSWSWPLAFVVNALALASTAAPLSREGLDPLAVGAIAVSLAALAVLASPAGRRALLHSGAPRR